MHEFNPNHLKQLYIPSPSSHKGQNGKVMVIGGSKLFHAASLWALEVAAHMVDMVYYASVAENNTIVSQAKEQFRNGIVVPRDKIHDYIEEADCILIGPGLPRFEGLEEGDDDTKTLTEYLLKKYPHKKWVIDGGSLQTMDIRFLSRSAILTPHQKEFEMLFKMPNDKFQMTNQVQMPNDQIKKRARVVYKKAKEYECVILLKGSIDIVCSPTECVRVSGGNAGMTKGGTGDVLAGLTAALYAKNEAFLSACAASYINKQAGDALFAEKGYWFTTSELAHEIPRAMKKLLL